jgi:hypothetical protein
MAYILFLRKELVKITHPFYITENITLYELLKGNKKLPFNIIPFILNTFNS